MRKGKNGSPYEMDVCITIWSEKRGSCSNHLPLEVSGSLDPHASNAVLSKFLRAAIQVKFTQ
jgi:hypothetical protein